MNWMKNLPWGKMVRIAAGVMTNLWAFLMLAVFPLYAPNRYFGLGDRKFEFFLWCSVLCLIPALLFLILQFVLGKKCHLSTMDRAVLFYAAAQLLSFLCSGYKQDAWVGARGWYMGLRTQLLMAAAYFCLSRVRIFWKGILMALGTGFGAVCLLGILHRFRIDPLGMYEGISEGYYLQFLSTIGQATWLSGYLCVLLTVCGAFFLFSRSLLCRLLAGLGCILGFGALVTQNSDSAFPALGILVLGLFVGSCGSMAYTERFLEWLILLTGSFKIIGLLQQIFPEQALELGSLSVFLSQSLFIWLALLAALVCYVIFLWVRMKCPEKVGFCSGTRAAKAAGVLVAAAGGGYALLVWLNTTRRLGIQLQHNYLLFDDSWGSYRGIIWKTAVQLTGRTNLLQKLVGVGPDCFWHICYEAPELSGLIRFYFGENQLLSNAHNEFLNMLICGGLLGLLALLWLMTAAVKRFGCIPGTEASGSYEVDPVVAAGGLAVLVYSAHNFFCYQQVCCTPFLFLLLGLAENRLRHQKNGIHN